MKLAVRVPIRGEPTLLGLLVDAVNQLLDVPREQIQQTLSVGTSVHPDYVRGLLHADGKLVLVLDIGRVLSTEELLRLPSPPVPAENSA